MSRRRSPSRRDLGRLAGAGALCWALTPTQAGAYLLPETFIFKKMSEQLTAAGSRQITLTGRAVIGGKIAAVGERWIFDQGRRRCQVDVNASGGGKAQWIWQADEGGPGAASGEAAVLPTPIERVTLSHLLSSATPAQLLDGLQVDRSILRLGLRGDRPMYVFGAEANDVASPQVWVDQDRFTVSLVRYRDARGALVQLTLDDWWGPPTPGAFPGAIKVQVGRRTMRQMALGQLRVAKGGQP